MGPRLILYTGKGGTGKSVISCATGIRAADFGHEALIASSDPAHTLSDALGVRVGDGPTKVQDKVWALQIDPVKEMQRNFALIQEYAASVFAARGIDEAMAYELASLPTMTQLFTLLKVEEFIREGRFDVVIMDTVASGEALRYLYFPRLIGSVTRKLIKLISPVAGMAKALEPIVGIPAPSGAVLKEHVALIERFDSLGQLLREGKTTSLRLIANPDSFSIANARRALMVSSLYGINVDLVILNKLLPEEIGDPYLREWISVQKKLSASANQLFYPVSVRTLKLFEAELKGVKMLREAGEMLFQEDPATVFFEGSPFRLEPLEDGLRLVVKVPYTDRSDIEVERIGDELILKVKTDVGEVVNVIPLPSSTLTMRLARAKLISSDLEVEFVKQHGRGQGI